MTEHDKTETDGLTSAEQDYLHGRSPVERRVERRRPGWMVVGMVWATFGLYVFFWVGLHWAEMKRERRDERMYPVWHSLSMMVPVYSYFRFHANFRVMNELLATTRSAHRVRPLLAIATFILASLLVAVPIEGMALMTLNLIAAVAAVSWTIHHGQTGMNAYWDTLPEQRTTDDVRIWERLVIAAGGGIWFIMIFGSLALIME